MKFLPLLAGLLLASPAAAQGTDPHTVLTLRGECQALAAGSEDLIDICAGEIMQVIYTDHRMELAIWTDSPSGRFLVFSGPATEDEAGLAQQIDLVIDGQDGSGNNNVDRAATGQCTLNGNPSEGPVQFTCEATDDAGNGYRFAFLTDGGVPENMLD
ncbi:hypothetical protein [Devosia ginsengisoli]|uniref:DUF3617 family protein n=1 Tax=Devosia ginsengisoli TaxID=400770 RepID=A0A5B8LP74_9HYPH|nr:hypothetical protein [Devosia ginsengisoli]QDZ09963.1 hypothetical protein FPZ08_03900 [Devosia ginsengisoli]